MNLNLIFIANSYFLNDLGLNKLSFFKDEMKMGNILIKRNNGKLYINNGYEETTIGNEDYKSIQLKENLDYVVQIEELNKKYTSLAKGERSP